MFLNFGLIDADFDSKVPAFFHSVILYKIVKKLNSVFVKKPVSGCKLFTKYVIPWCDSQNAETRYWLRSSNLLIVLY